MKRPPTTPPSRGPGGLHKRPKAAPASDARLAVRVDGNARHARKRGVQRWHALLKRIGTRNGLEEALGTTHWRDFTDHAARNFKEPFLRRFEAVDGTLRCVGRLGEGPCPRAACACDLSPSFLRDLSGLHLDHAVDVNHVCSLWKGLVPPRRHSWADGIDAPTLMQLLFGSNVQFRCAPPKDTPRDPTVRYCHDTRLAHYGHTLRPRDLAAAGDGALDGPPSAHADSEMPA